MTTQPDAVTQAEYWNGQEARHWLAYEDRYEAMLGPFTRHVMSALDLAADDAVLDVGCGCGATTLAAARTILMGGPRVASAVLSDGLAPWLAYRDVLGNSPAESDFDGFGGLAARHRVATTAIALKR